MLFNDIWSQEGHSVSCMTILFLNLKITRSDIRPHIKWGVSLVIAYGHFNLCQEVVWVRIGEHTHFLTPEGFLQASSCSIVLPMCGVVRSTRQVGVNGG